MKSVILFLLMVSSTVFSSDVYAFSCTSSMKYSNGQTFLNFTRYNSRGLRAACQDANYDCQRDLRYRLSRGEIFGGYCEVRRQTNQRFSCNFDMVTRRGHLVQGFTARGRDFWQACRNAENRCVTDLRYRQSQGRNPYARCIKRNGGGQTGHVTRHCRVDRVDIYNRFIQMYNAQASGPRNSGVKRRACRQAMRVCRSNCWGDQKCIRMN